MAEQISFTLPPELAVEDEKIRRNQALYDALLSQSMTQSPTQFVGNRAVPRHWSESLAKVAQAYMAGKGLEGVEAQKKELAGRYQQGQAADFSKLQQGLEGTPEIPAPSEELGGGPGAPAQPATLSQKRKAIVEAMASPYSSVRGTAGIQQKFVEADAAREDAQAFQAEQRRLAQEAQAEQRRLAAEANKSPLQRLMAERDALPEGDPRRATFDAAIAKQTTHQPGTTVNVNQGKKFFEEVQKGTGEKVITEANQARASLDTINTVNQIRGALDSGKVIAGPGTTARQFMGQLGQTLGIAGADATEQLTNTRQAIQGLAQLELNAAQQMKGQGQITEAERSIIRRAASGDIDSMTVKELRSLTNVLDRAARFKISSNAANVAKLRKQPGAAEIVDYLDVEMPPEYVSPQPAAAPAAPAGVRVVDW